MRWFGFVSFIYLTGWPGSLCLSSCKLRKHGCQGEQYYGDKGGQISKGRVICQWKKSQEWMELKFGKTCAFELFFNTVYKIHGNFIILIFPYEAFLFSALASCHVKSLHSPWVFTSVITFSTMPSPTSP